jgi:hypothetical protein
MGAISTTYNQGQLIQGQTRSIKENKGMKKRNGNKRIMMIGKYKNKTKNESSIPGHWH